MRKGLAGKKACATSGNTMLEATLFIPIIVLLLMGMISLGKLGYTYYTLHKTLYTLARYLGTQQGVNFCDEADPIILAAKAYALSGTTDSTAEPILAGLTADMIQVSIERVDPTTESNATCECSASGCDTSQGGLAPDFIVVSLTDGFPFQFNIPMLPLDPIPLRPQIRIPYGGT
jgi:Flp pilus assembly protein TadG